MDSSKIQKVLDWPQSRNLKKVQGFLGFGNFNHQFIKNYSLIIILLMELIKKNAHYKWIDIYKLVFRKLKELFTKILCLTFFSLKKPIRIETDISDKDIETYLL